MYGDSSFFGWASGLLAALATSGAEPEEKAAAHLGADEMQRRDGGTRLPQVLGEQHPLSFLAGGLSSRAEQQQPTARGALEKVQHARPESSGRRCLLPQASPHPLNRYLNVNHLHPRAVPHSQHPGVGGEVCPAPGRRITEGERLRVLVDCLQPWGRRQP